MHYGGTMKGSNKNYINLEFWNRMFAKMNQLLVRIESTNPSIDDTELRWVSDRIEYFNGEERVLSREEMRIANELWSKYA